MAKLTLLQIVQNTLSAMEALQVNDIDDSEESAAISKIAEEVFFEFVSQGDWPHLIKVSQLDSVSDSTKPNFLEIPDNFQEIKEVFYNDVKLEFMETDDFISYVNSRNSDADDVEDVTTFQGVRLKIVNNKDPKYFTLFEDTYVVTDSYDETEGSTLSGTNSIVRALVTPTWTSSNTFIPDLLDKMFPTYLAMVKRKAFLYLRREQSLADERQALSGMGRLFRDVDRLDTHRRVVDYGRKK